MIYLTLFITFCKIGFTSFGGMSMVPLISSEMLSHHWMTEAEVLDIVAIAEMTPGPLGINCATFAGMRSAGILGALIANLGVAMPTLTLCALAAVFLEKYNKSTVMNACMVGIRPATVGLILGALIQLGQSTFIMNEGISYTSVAIAVVIGVLIFKFKQSIPRAIMIAGVLGILLVK